MNIAYTTACLTRNAGGLFSTQTAIINALSKIEGVNVSIIGGKDIYYNADINSYPSGHVFPYDISRVPLLKQLGYSREIQTRLYKLTPDIINIQGIWMYHSKASFDYSVKNPMTKTIIQPHGMLDKWALNRSAWKKRIVGYWYEYENLKNADCLLALCESEYESIRALGLRNPVAIIPNGIDLPETKLKRSEKNKKVLLFIGRIHPKKGLRELIEGLKKVKRDSSDFFNKWSVRIAGWDQNGTLEELRNSVVQYDLDDDVHFIGPIFGDEKAKELSNADAFILPSFSEGLPMTILEAWSYKLPVLMTNECNIPEGFDMGAAFRITTDSDDIASKLQQLNSCDERLLIEMGQNGFNLVSDRFTWNNVAKDTMVLYKWLCGETSRPGFVYEN